MKKNEPDWTDNSGEQNAKFQRHEHGMGDQKTGILFGRGVESKNAGEKSENSAHQKKQRNYEKFHG